MTSDLIELVQNLGRPRVLVVGDVMLDRYVWGDAERISQEAPVILLRADKREERLGGASSVATMLSALQAEVSLVGVVGTDSDGKRVREILDNLRVDNSGVTPDGGRPTTVKERYIGRAQHKHPQQMLRVDFETREPVSGEVESRLCEAIASEIQRADVVLVSDYDKGVCTPAVLATTVDAARQRGIRVIADPIRGRGYEKYRGCSSITPNRLEAGIATGRTVDTNEQAIATARQLRDDLDLEAGIVTLDKDGMALAHRDRTETIYPTRARQVYDITGAGDMVMSVLGLALAAGADYPSAIRLANVAGGLEVEKIGVATVTREEILNDLFHSPAPADSLAITTKIRALPRLVAELEARRRLGQKIAFTNGCFDILHLGHVQYLTEARAQADCLVVGLNTDASVRSLKGTGRPVNSEDARAAVLAALRDVDYLVLFDESTPIELIKAVRPDVLVKGADYRRDQVVGADLVESYGGRVHLAGLREGYSTTKLIQQMRVA
ncbi:MAG TPA: D-glycero-beta-D-manno-heptose 1-phosphate adenylyltransferase [Gemmataceae bacterium]|jgi:D-beta-D-heptose 7-phosphate kinase/D-beta-D-heptose 1-phosphate adenosyltransferase|nr:D-glycero-beta-D-manno-heptose 1-phosphate adenylyltransferase [Gemmataceae bacterium]